MHHQQGHPAGRTRHSGNRPRRARHRHRHRQGAPAADDGLVEAADMADTNDHDPDAWNDRERLER
jgi:hypothetical protein